MQLRGLGNLDRLVFTHGPVGPSPLPTINTDWKVDVKNETGFMEESFGEHKVEHT